MYFILDCEEPLNENGEALMRIGNTFQVGDVWSWKSGQRFEDGEANFESPIRIEFEPLRGYVGSPVDLLDLGIPIMSERVAVAMEAAGVSNIEWFDALITNVVTRQTFAYRAYNVIGLIAAADLGKSEWESADAKLVGDVSFEALALDASKAKGALLFRLAENVNALVVHERVRATIEGVGIATLKFALPEDWVQI